MHGRFETYIRPGRGFAAWPTNDDLTLVIAGWPFNEFAAYRQNLEANYVATLEQVPTFAERIRGATRETRLVGTAVPNFLRKPYGPGWVLVGDAGYNKDFITAFGIHDAVRDAELCAHALDQTFTGTRDFNEALTDYHSTRDQHVRRGRVLAVRGLHGFSIDGVDMETAVRPDGWRDRLLARSGDRVLAVDNLNRVGSRGPGPGVRAPSRLRRTRAR